jgi:hypothetical protein
VEKEQIISEIRKRLADCPIPLGSVADYAGSNHFEIQAPLPHAYWWLDGLYELFLGPDPSATLMGKRLGACLDLACSWRPDVTELLSRIDELELDLARVLSSPKFGVDLFNHEFAEGADDGK